LWECITGGEEVSGWDSEEEWKLESSLGHSTHMPGAFELADALKVAVLVQRSDL